MPSHCSTDCSETKYKTKEVEVTDEEYNRIKQALGKIESEEKKERKGQLEKLLGDIQQGISQATSQLKNLTQEYNKLSKEYQQYKE
jgi:uncharacterized protein YjbJ (UPF0337 family)